MPKILNTIGSAELRKPSVLMLIGVNIIPLLGVLMLGWNVGFIMLLYWLETVIIGLFNIPKILTAQKTPQGTNAKVGVGGRLFIVIFFAVHYGIFNFGHYAFLKDMFDLPPIGLDVLIAVAGLGLSHGVSLIVNWFGKREYAHNDPSLQMFKPYGRVVIMHVVIILGGFFVLAFKGAWIVLVLLIVLKTLADVLAHVKGHEFNEIMQKASENSAR